MRNNSSVRVRISPGALKLIIMEKIICPKCGNEITIDISKAIDENGEIFLCKECKWQILLSNDKIQHFNWALIRPNNIIEIYNEMPSHHPLTDTIIKNVTITTTTLSNIILIEGDELIIHYVIRSVPITELDWIPKSTYTYVVNKGLFKKKPVVYVKQGWVIDAKTKKYKTKFSGYSIRFFVSDKVKYHCNDLT